MTGTETRVGRGRHARADDDTITAVLRPLVDVPTQRIPLEVVPDPVPEPATALVPVPSRGVLGLLSPVLAVAAVALLPLAAATTDLDALDGWGLGRVLGPAAWASVLCAVAACVTELRSRRPRGAMLTLATGVLVLCSVGLPSVVEPVARFSTAWLLAGFADAISHSDGVPPTGTDARFYWPAFFAQWAFFRDAGGATQLDSVLRWFPPVVVTVWAVGIHALARSMLGGSRAPWVAVWLFVGLNWIEQDYFSPQATGIVLLLVVLAFVLGPLATRRTDAAGAPGWPAPHPDAARLPLLRRWAVAAMTPPNRPALPPRQLLLVYFCVALCLLAVAPTHQLTPFAIIGQLVLLAVVGRFRGRGLVVVAVFSVVVYVLIAGRDLWLTQLSLIIGGKDDDALTAGLLDRLTGDTGQIAVKVARILLALATWLLAVAGARAYWRRRRDLVPIGLAVVPMGFAAVQSYGGELLLRVVLYGLPILAILGADALRTAVRRRPWLRGWLAVGMAVLFATLVVVRGGNDAYQVVYPQEVAMARYAVAASPPGQEIVPLSHLGPYGLEGIDTHPIGDFLDGCSELVDDPDYCVVAEDADVLVTFTSVEKQGVVLNGKEPGWSLELIQKLVASGRYVLTYQNGFDAVLTKVVPDAGGG